MATIDNTGTAVAHDAGAEVHALADGLAAAAASLEPEFVRMAAALGSLTQNARRLAELGSGLATRVDARLQHLRGAGLGDLIRNALQAMQANLGDSERRLQGIRDNDHTLARLAFVGRRLRGLSTQLCVTRFGFSIETARLDGEQEAAFVDFVAQLAKVERLFAQLGGGVSETVTVARQGQAKAAQSIQRGLTEFGRLSGRCETSAKSAAAAVDRLLQSFAQGAGRIAGAVATVNACIEQLVYFLQIGDIVRQKIEHVAAALARGAESAGRLADAVQLQRAQLEAVRRDAVEAGNRLGDAFQRLGAATEALVAPVREMVALVDAGDATASFAGLLQDVRELQSLGSRAHEIGAATTRAAADAAAVAQAIVEQFGEVEETNATMHMMALNAIVNTSRLGSTAAALSVLSVQVHEVARDSGAIVAEVGPLVGRLRVGEQPTATAAAGEPRGDAMAQSLDELAQLAAAVHESGAGANELAQSQQRGLAAAIDDVRFLGGLGERLGHAVAALQRITAIVGPGSGAPASDAAYTMESEREVHRRVVLGQPAPAAAATATATATAALGDNVELF